MATIIGGITTSHIPAIGGAIASGKQEEPYWKPLFDGYPPVHEWLAEQQPDVAVVFYNDHGLNWFVDAMPTFSVGAADLYANADEGWGLPELPSFPGHPGLSWHIIESLVEDSFDVVMCQEMVVDHGLVVPYQLLWGSDERPVQVVPICVNTVLHPMPRPDRCHALGQAVGRAIEAFPGNEKVVVLGTGGLSHQLDGERAGFINKDFDLQCMDAIVNDPNWIAKHSILDLVELSGAQGVELVLWLAMRGSLLGDVTELHRNYHIPISNTGAGLMLLGNR